MSESVSFEAEPAVNNVDHDAPTMEHVPCPMCGADEPTHLFVAQEMLYGLDESFTIVQCNACGLRYTNPRPMLEHLGRYYPDDYYSEQITRDGGKRSVRESGWRERITRITLRAHFGYPGDRPGLLTRMGTRPWAMWLRYGRKPINALPWTGQGRLLDYGFGYPKFMALQEDRGWQVTGIDFNETIVNEIRSQNMFEVAAGTWPGEAFADRQFDVITAWHVLEHHEAPVQWVKFAADRLAPGGYLLIACPDVDSWGYRWFAEHWFGLDVPRHFQHFTKDQLCTLCEQAGLHVERVRGQVRPTPLRRSAVNKARRTGSTRWKFLSRRKGLWKFIARLAGMARKADCVIIYARKP